MSKIKVKSGSSIDCTLMDNSYSCALITERRREQFTRDPIVQVNVKQGRVIIQPSVTITCSLQNGVLNC